MVRRSITRFAFVAMLCCLRSGAAQYENCTNGTVAVIGNGMCDAASNNPSCGYDGGDCCPCTCADSPAHACADSDFDCIFPECDDPTASAEESSPTCTEDSLGDGFCNPENNRASCDYDGGDCCGCTCAHDGSAAVCGSFGFDCRDPACFDSTVVARYPECSTGGWLTIGDGTCQEENNNLSCGYDGGDCCLCSCSGSACVISGFRCSDPDADDEMYECKPPPPAALPCSAGVQQTWVVDNPAQAQALAAAVNCSGGSFEVEWRGSVVVDKPIYVADGTVLTVTGVGSDAVINGNASSRLFTVVDAALHVNGVTIGYGFSPVGGAIAAAGSSLTFNQTDFIGNRADGNGGAIYVSDGSSVSCAGGTFLYNSAGSDGGAMYVTGSSVVSCGGSWFRNSAGDSAGALMIADYSSVSWSDDTAFAFNAAERFGGAVYASFGSSVSWNASSTIFDSNSAWFLGGAMFVAAESSVSWTGATTFDSNSARSNVGSGGALAVFSYSHASWRGVTTYMNNAVGADGGGVYIDGVSSASWDDGITTFTDNFARGNGGGIAVSGTSHVSCTEETTSTFSGNSATNGGAISVEAYSNMSFRGNASFDGNRANETAVNGTGFGGAISVLENATATWYGSLTFTGNTAVKGGALFVEDAIASWSGATAVLALNSASQQGGAIFARRSGVSWFAETKYLDNLAGEHGGALFAGLSSVSWSGETDFFNNAAGDTGGALHASQSSILWIGETIMSNNTGGALFLASSTVSWKGNTTFAHNIVENGPGGAALSAFLGSHAFWGEGYTKFIGNYARFDGGALFVTDGSEIAWTGDTEFVGNIAERFGGGAVYISNGANVSWTGDTRFTSNAALTADGGAVGTDALASGNIADSNLVINGTTTFSNNAAGENGGGLALLGVCTLTINPAVDISFVGNTAAVAGGAIFLSGANVGPTLTDVSFVSNSAEIGGAVSIFGSGTKQPGDFHTTFDRCRFIDNRAVATGGAINSAAGKDAIFNSVFEGNSAGTGGALRLAGTASVYDCSFVENSSDDGEGAAVSNIGFMESVANIYFDGNRFDCPSAMFLDYNAFGDPLETACQGCETTCDGCVFAEGLLAPICRDVLDHSTSNGGNVTLQALSIKRGFWRATASSEAVLTCYNADACLGGVTGTSGYCLDGYEGPYCSVCSDGYSAQLSFSCSKCSENSAGGIVFAVVLGIGAFFVGVAVVSYVISGETGLGAGQGLVERVTRYIPLQSAKILIVAWQILTQFSSVANVIYPGVYQDFLDGLDFFNFDLAWVLSAGCVVDIDFHDRLLVSTITPIVALLFLACTYAAAVRINRGKPESLKIVQNKHVSMVLLLTFLVYSSVSSTLFKAFACEELDDDKYYLRSDYRIECDSSKHRSFQAYAAVMIVLYTVGIPVFYSSLLFKGRDVLKIDQATRREDPPRVTATSSLWKPYTPKVFYYEVIECARRILLAGVVVFIYPNTAAQVAVTLMIAFAFVVISEGLAPYTSPWDTWISRMGHVVVFVSMYAALLLKVDVSDERVGSQKVFEAVLVAVHACMVLAVVVETVVASCSLKARPQENPSPRLHGDKSLTRIGSKGKRGNTFWKTSSLRGGDLDTES